MSLEFIRELPASQELKSDNPLTQEKQNTVQEKRQTLKSIFSGSDNRIVMIIGPCSADNEESILDYVSRLADIQKHISEKIVIVPRIYTAKPRTNGKGYKGLIHQPNPELKSNIVAGIEAARKLHVSVVNSTNFICADELLYPEVYEYLDDILGYVAIGARSVENQIHRLVASGITVPVGMKNPISGDLSVMMNSIVAAQSQHVFPYDSWECRSSGNPWAHAILRGFSDEHGSMYSNYHFEYLIKVKDLYQHSELKNPGIIVDCNHCNSHKRPLEQPRIIREVLRNCIYAPELKDIVKGFMVESYLEDGKQEVGNRFYGKSITDACLGWNKTEQLFQDMWDML